MTDARNEGRHGAGRLRSGSRWGLRTIAVIGALTLLATACGGGSSSATNPSASSSGGIKEGGILRLGSSSTIDSLNPFKAFEQDAYNVFFNIYPFLTQYDANLQLTGDFGTDWQWSSDDTSVTFTTHDGGTWSDGTPLTANDVAYTINLILRFPGPTGLEAGYAKHISSAKAKGDTTVTINYEEPVNQEWALSQLELIPILPEQVWSQHEGDGGHDLRVFTNDAPIVSGGPFVLQKYEKRQIAQFTVNPGYYGPKPHIDGFGLKFYTNTDAMISDLRSGGLDAVETLPATVYDTLKSDPNLSVTETQGINEDDFITNANKPIHPELLDPKVREAFAHAIDYQQIVDTALAGHGEVATTFVPPVTGGWHDPSIQPVTYDIAAANQILDQLGFKKGSDGIRIANGHPMAYTVLTPNDIVGVDREFQVIQAGFEQIGVKLTQRSLDPDALFVAIAGPDYESYDSFDLALWNWYMLIDPDFALSVLTCEQWGFWSDTGYCNKQYDKLYNQQGITVNPSDRQKIVYEMQRMIFADKPYIMLDYRNWIEAHTVQWDGFVITPQGSFNNLSKLTLENVHMVG